MDSGCDISNGPNLMFQLCHWPTTELLHPTVAVKKFYEPSNQQGKGQEHFYSSAVRASWNPQEARGSKPDANKCSGQQPTGTSWYCASSIYSRHKTQSPQSMSGEHALLPFIPHSGVNSFFSLNHGWYILTAPTLTQVSLISRVCKHTVLQTHFQTRTTMKMSHN